VAIGTRHRHPPRSILARSSNIGHRTPNIDSPRPALAIIPARYASTRLPGKPLLAETGRPLIQHVVEQVSRAQRVARVLVATDDPRIADAVASFGGDAVMTRDDHPNGTSRLAEVVQSIGCEPDELVLNIQGDEPEIDPAVIDALAGLMHDQPDLPMGTVAAPLDSRDELGNPNVVKLVCDRRGHALYFSRAAIPHHRDAGDPAPPYRRHLGLYAYRAAFLPVYADLAPTPLEEAEKLEQLRALEHGHAIGVALTDHAHAGIDTPEQYAAFVQRWRAGGAAAE
jgi:3-deoxy-manno-octulosonate cytidylyltransferase (CMP-KDO synthetase)